MCYGLHSGAMAFIVKAHVVIYGLYLVVKAWGGGGGGGGLFFFQVLVFVAGCE